MRKIHAQASFGFCGATHETIFEFEDDVTEEEIDEEVWEWATQFVDICWEEEEA